MTAVVCCNPLAIALTANGFGTELSLVNEAHKTLEGASAMASHDRLKQLVHYIEHREPCFPFDLAGR